MTLNNIGEFILAAILCVIGVRMLMMYAEEYSKRRVERLASRGEYAQAVDYLYSMMWTGMPYDEIDAWNRVIWYLEEYQYGPEMITEAKLRWLCRLYHGRNVRYDEKPEASNPFQGSKHYPVQHPEGESWIQLSGETGDGRRETEVDYDS